MTPFIQSSASTYAYFFDPKCSAAGESHGNTPNVDEVTDLMSSVAVISRRSLPIMNVSCTNRLALPLIKILLGCIDRQEATGPAAAETEACAPPYRMPSVHQWTAAAPLARRRTATVSRPAVQFTVRALLLLDPCYWELPKTSGELCQAYQVFKTEACTAYDLTVKPWDGH